jgi:hypothetical protein
LKETLKFDAASHNNDAQVLMIFMPFGCYVIGDFGTVPEDGFYIRNCSGVDL